jgi:hypothetical protein
VNSEARQNAVQSDTVALRPGLDSGEKLTKIERAQVVAKLFPVLIGRRPRERKPCESEHYSMSIFTAAALASVGSRNSNAYLSPSPLRPAKK